MCCERTEPCCRSPGRRPTSDATREPAQVERPLSALAAYALHMIPIGRCRIFLSDRLLADQLLAAKLNVAASADLTPIRAVLQEADGRLSQGFAGKLPDHVNPSSPTGQQMVEEATVFESYNIGDLTATCQPAQVSAR